jgi:uncharacterized RDD family membrane protein YckC
VNTDAELTRFPSTTTCARCGHPRAPGDPEGLCARCLLAAAIDPATQDLSDQLPTMSTGGGSMETADRLQPGQHWGAYRIGRLLGRGGMGEVYEAEHLESGRRLALKVLRSRAQTPDERARFLREGQLAASITHPHTVYIFGSEEIDGLPAISMELLPGGTLKDRIVAAGPLAPHEAVSAILDILGGLDAAHAAGILHRDIKPSNCFVDVDGTVKVGDFGLSISTLARELDAGFAGGFQGTPQFAPPEQLRGEPLDVRADIYAVGATLYYLLTGQPPFDARDLRDLIERVINQPPASPRRARPDVAPALAAAVLRCLAKDPRDRPATYAELAEALRPFATYRQTAAPLGVRAVAGLVDALLTAIPTSLAAFALADPSRRTQAATAIVMSWSWVPAFAYYWWLETRWYASLGKRLFGLRVVSMTHAHPGARQIAVRTAIYHTPDALLALWLLSAGAWPAEAADTYRQAIMLLGLALLFATARRSNGYAALQDRVSGTRVVVRAPDRLALNNVERLARGAAPLAIPTVLGRVSPAAPRYGPFVAEPDPHQGSSTDVRVAFDPVLRRPVWIQEVADGTAPVAEARRDAARITRLRWLTGRRVPGDNWDAFEAPSGQPFSVTSGDTVDWITLKLWLLDLAGELDTATREGTRPALGLDRLWLRSDGRLLLLDFPAPHSARARPVSEIAGGLVSPATVTDDTPHALIAAVARRAPLADPGALPLSARTFLASLTGPVPPSLDALHASLTTVAKAPDRIARWRRSLPSLLAAAPVILAIGVAALAALGLRQVMTPANGEILQLLTALRDPAPQAGSRMADPQYRQAAEHYVAGKYGTVVSGDEFWSSVLTQRLARDLRPTADDIVRRNPSVSTEELARAAEIVSSARPGRPRANDDDVSAVFGIIVSTVAAVALLFVVCCGLLSAVVVPGGLASRLLGLATVNRHGREISRIHSLLRALVAWSPALVWMLYLAASPRIQRYVPAPRYPLTAAAITLGVLAGGAAWTMLRPVRGPHDIVARTWVVPR